jgi:hypothetical protein
MKKFAMLAVVFAFTLSLVGCGAAPTSAPKPADKGATTPPPAGGEKKADEKKM